MSRAPAETAASSVSSTLHALANEPSVGLHYVAEHIKRSTPALLSTKADVARAGAALSGAARDAEDALKELSAATAGGTRASLANAARLAASSTALASKGAR